MTDYNSIGIDEFLSLSTIIAYKPPSLATVLFPIAGEGIKNGREIAR